MHTESAKQIQLGSEANGPGFASFLIVIIRPGTFDEKLASFPFSGTLEQAEAEGRRLLSCFTDRIYLMMTVCAWYEGDEI